MSAPQQYYNPFWDFVADLEERGLPNGWFGRRGGPGNRGMNRRAQQGEAADANANVRPNAWTQAPHAHGPVPHRFRGGPGRRHGPHHHQHEHAVPVEQARAMTPDSEKTVENEKTVLFDQSEGENVTAEKPTQRGPGARLGGRGGRGNGMGPRARRAAAAAAQEAEKNATAESGDEKANSATEGPRQGGPRRAGRGGPRGGRGLGQGRGQHMGPRRAARIAALYEEMMAGPYGQFFMGPMGGPRRGGPGFGRGNGFGPRGGRHGLAGPHAFPAQFPFAPQQGPGAGRGGRGMGAGRGRGNGMGRGRGAAMAARQFNQANALPLRGGPGRFANGPNGVRQGPHAGRACPRHGMRQGNMQAGPAGPGPRNGGGRKPNAPFRPLVDVYDHSEAFIIHASLPGAKKEDVEVNFDSEKSVLIITGQIHRSGDEELLKTLSKKERRIGAFQRRVKLGNKQKPALIEVDDITAKIQEGVLEIHVPKIMPEAGFVEVRKVDVN